MKTIPQVADFVVNFSAQFQANKQKCTKTYVGTFISFC